MRGEGYTIFSNKVILAKFESADDNNLSLCASLTANVQFMHTTKIFLHKIYPVAVVCSAFTLSACSSLDNFNPAPAYQGAQQTEALEIPPDLTAPSNTNPGIPEIVAAEASAKDVKEFDEFNELKKFDEFEQYKLWKQSSTTSEQLDFQSFIAAKEAVEENSRTGNGVTIDRMVDESRQITIESKPDVAWKILNIAVNAMGISVQEQQDDKYNLIVILPNVGKKSVFKPSGDQFQLIVKKDLRSSLIRLFNHRGDLAISPEANAFITQLSNQLRFAKIKLELEQNIAGQDQLSGSLTELTSGQLELALETTPQTVWQQIDYTADQIGFTIVERKPEQGTFIIRFSSDTDTEEKKKGLEKLAFWKKDDADDEFSDLYRVLIKGTNENTSIITVENFNGQSTVVSNEILELLRKGL